MKIGMDSKTSVSSREISQSIKKQGKKDRHFQFRVVIRFQMLTSSVKVSIMIKRIW